MIRGVVESTETVICWSKCLPRSHKKKKKCLKIIQFNLKLISFVLVIIVCINLERKALYCNSTQFVISFSKLYRVSLFCILLNLSYC